MISLPRSVSNGEEGDILRVRADHRTISGRANPVSYRPGEAIEIEIRTEDHEPVRYKLHSTHAEGEWGPLTLKRSFCQGDSRRWEAIGTVDDLTTTDPVRDTDESDR